MAVRLNSSRSAPAFYYWRRISLRFFDSIGREIRLSDAGRAFQPYVQHPIETL
jgi:hypothetical protein